ncbi:hypothetical protein [Streptomyces luteireticuli]|uniref:hypothetical protein n=1 Tax=Streptomyces luteireticuli TaxID=173858 RepID=UPI00355765DF
MTAIATALAVVGTAPGPAAAGSKARAAVFGSSIAAARNYDGRLELFGTNSGDGVFHRFQGHPGTAWSPWYQFDGALRAVAAETNADGRMELFGVNGAGPSTTGGRPSPRTSPGRTGSRWTAP